MNTLKARMWFWAGYLSPIPALVLYFYGNFYNVIEPFSLGMFFGIIGFIYFANVLIISSRIRYFDRIFGHDRVLQYHGYMAMAALLAALLHRFFKAMVFSDFSGLQIQGGQIALVLFLVVIGITVLFMVPGKLHRLPVIERLRVFVNVRLGLDYSLLKLLHNLLAVAFALVLLHVLLASSTLETNTRLAFTGLWGGMALLLWLKHKIWHLVVLYRRRFRVAEVIHHADSYVEVRIAKDAVKGFCYKAGQFVFIRFPRSAAGNEEHPYTLSSSPSEDQLAITAKDLGDYSRRLRLLKPGDSALLDGPYGRFSIKASQKGPFVLIAGGIGITPFYSILKDLDPGDTREFVLLWAVRRHSDLIFDKEFRALTACGLKLRYIPLISDEPAAEGEEQGFITRDILERYAPDIAAQSVYFCGPAPMRRAVFAVLEEAGVRRRGIHFEMFSFG